MVCKRFGSSAAGIIFAICFAEVHGVGGTMALRTGLTISGATFVKSPVRVKIMIRAIDNGERRL